MRCFGSVSELRAALKREGARGGGLGEQGVAAPLAAAHSGGAGVPGAAAEADAGPRGLANKEPMRIGYTFKHSPWRLALAFETF